MINEACRNRLGLIAQSKIVGGDLAVLLQHYDHIILKWNRADFVQSRLLELLADQPMADEIAERIIDEINVREAIEKKSNEQLVDLVLDNISKHTDDENYGLLIQEVCTRLDPTWGARAEAEDAAKRKESHP